MRWCDIVKGRIDRRSGGIEFRRRGLLVAMMMVLVFMLMLMRVSRRHLGAHTVLLLRIGNLLATTVLHLLVL
jgi:hypothetical protein